MLLGAVHYVVIHDSIQQWQQIAIAVVLALVALVPPVTALFTVAIKSYGTVRALGKEVAQHDAVILQQTEAINQNAITGNMNGDAINKLMQVGAIPEALPLDVNRDTIHVSGTKPVEHDSADPISVPTTEPVIVHTDLKA